MGASSVLPPPRDIGAPDKYSHWRHMQAEAVLSAAESTKRFVGQGAPTGFGKSLVYVSQAKLTDARTVILTSTKALQSQLFGDFSESGLIEIKGLNSYECVEGRPTGRFGDVRREGFRVDRGLPMACDEAPCQAGAFCPKREGGCLYYDAYRKAVRGKLVVTNYSYWMNINKYGEDKLGDVDLLVLDEAHNALDELGEFIGTSMRQSDIETVLPVGKVPSLLPPSATMEDWVLWATHWHMIADVTLESLKEAIREAEREGSNRKGDRVNHSSLKHARDLKRLISKLATVASMKGDWVIDHTEDRERRPLVKFDPVWPGVYAEDNLFCGVPKVVMVSATMRPKTAHMLGISPADLDFKEYPSTFPKNNRPIIYLPTAKMSRNSEKASMPEMITRVDQIIGRRPDRKGIIHTVSYERARAVYRGSTMRERLLQHDGMNAREVIARFKESKEPLVLISPVLDTGYDFPYEQCEFQIIIKVPFLVTTDKIVNARCERDKEYKDYMAMVKLVQMSGRIVRAEDDQGETFILDTDFWWYYFKNNAARLAPNSFREAVRTDQMLLPPMPKLKRRA